MKIKQQSSRGGYKWIIVYEDGEWNKLKEAYEDLGLSLASTQQPFGHQEGTVEPLAYYQETGHELLDKIQENPLTAGVNAIDEINSPIIKREGSGRSDAYRFNVAVLRAVPRDDPSHPGQKITEIKGNGAAALDYFKYGKKYNEDFKKIYESLFNTPVDFEVTLRPRRLLV